MDNENSVCVFCGKPVTTRDHVPPKGLFPTPRPTTLITVPSCDNCNGGNKLHDEYFKTMLCMREYKNENGALKKLIPDMFSKLGSTKKTGFRTSLLNNLDHIDIQTKSGIIVPNKLASKIDMSRMNRVIERTVRGLYYHEMKQMILKSNVQVRVIFYEDMDTSTEETKNIIKAVYPMQIITIEDDIFNYRFVYDQDKPAVSVWLLCFYKEFYVFGITSPIVKPELNLL
ncbi:MAG: hypothetical protein KAH14_01675 [Clostridiales bacterium]|nr:hypothetical protein [Clostridiales bacterium]